MNISEDRYIITDNIIAVFGRRRLIIYLFTCVFLHQIFTSYYVEQFA